MKMKTWKRMWIGSLVAMLLTTAGMANAAVAVNVELDLDKIGIWDGTTPVYQLPGNYIDWNQQNTPFGERNYYYAPWRSYMDTRDSADLLEAMAFQYDTNIKPEYAEAVSQALHDAGIQSVRMEIPWMDIDYDDETRLTATGDVRLTTILNAFKKYGIRPLVLLNFNSGLPAPYKRINVTVQQNAGAGSKEIFVKDVSGIVPGYTGLEGQEYKAMYPVITAADPKTGKLTLSDTLRSGVNAGDLRLIKLKYQPFSGAKFADGSVNPAAQETVNGWMKYVAAVAGYLKGKLGTGSNAGFDFEVWNEYTMNPDFLDINNYYNPHLQFSQEISYTEGSRTMKGTEILLPLTANYIKSNAYPGVNVISGFSNQRPWDNGTEMWNNQDGFSKHYYTAYDPNRYLITQETAGSQTTHNALGVQDPYVPNFQSALPEFWFYAYQTEYLARETQPYPGPFQNHFRYSNNGNWKEAKLWMSETNFVRDAFAKEVSARKGMQPTDPGVRNLLHQMMAKALLRTNVFLSHKGIQKIFTYALHAGGDLDYASIPDAFFNTLDNNGFKLDAAARSLLGPELSAISHLSAFMKTGAPIQSPRKINVDAITEYKPRIVFNGDGTPGHPVRYQADDLAILPYQLAHNRFAVGYYVVTRDLTHVWNPAKDEMDPARYAMPDQDFEITLSNIKGTGAQVSVFDPVSGEQTPLNAMKSTGSTVTVRVPASDYPRFVVVQENAEQPSFGNVRLVKTASGPNMEFTSSASGNVKVTWGQYPNRETGAVTVRRYAHFDAALANPLTTAAAGGFQFYNSLGAGLNANGYFRTTGKIRPKYTEKYTFILDGDTCNTKLYVGGVKIMDPCQPKMQAAVELKAGTDYDVEVVSFHNSGQPHTQLLYWQSRGQPLSLVPAKSDGTKEINEPVTKNRAVSIPMPGLKEGDAIRLEMAGDGITLTYPQWDFDLQSVWNSHTPAPGDSPGTTPAPPVTPTPPPDSGVPANPHPAPGDSPGTTPTPPASPTPPPDSGELSDLLHSFTYTVAGNASHRLETDNHSAFLELQAGSFSGETTLRIGELREASPKPYPLPGHFIQASPFIKVEASNAKLELHKPAIFTLHYDSGITAEDEKKIGIYRYDEKAGKWLFQGSGADRGSRTVKAEVQEAGIYAVLANSHTFRDIPGNYWAKQAIDIALGANFIQGYDDGKFYPGKIITRKEFIVMLLSSMGIAPPSAPSKLPFADVKEGDWSLPYLAYAYSKGILKGADATSLQPDRAITREEIAALLSRIQTFQPGANAWSFKDENQISSWAMEALELLTRAGIFHGYADGKIGPQNSATRAEVAQLLVGVLKYTGKAN